MSANPMFEKILSEMLAMHCRKGADYGTSEDIFANIRASEEFGIDGWKGAILRANDKMSRLKAFFIHGNLKNESVEDSLLDLANYAVIGLCLYREKLDAETKTILDSHSVPVPVSEK